MSLCSPTELRAMVVMRVNTCFPAMYVLLYHSILLLSLFGQGSNLRSSNSECNIYLAMGSIFELEAQITSAHIHTYIYQHTKHNNSLSLSLCPYCRLYSPLLWTALCRLLLQLPRFTPKKASLLLFCILVEIKMCMKIL